LDVLANTYGDVMQDENAEPFAAAGEVRV